MNDQSNLFVLESKQTARENTELILQYTTAIPYRLTGLNINCVCCFDSFTDPVEYRKHFQQDHTDFKIKNVLDKNNTNSLPKVDCTDLCCRICSRKFDMLDEIAEHLEDAHDIAIDVNAGFALLPNKYDGLKVLCALCNFGLSGLRQLSYHMSTHYRTYICETCGKVYITKAGLLTHFENIHKKKVFRCARCKKTLESLQQLKEHRQNSKECWPYRCRICRERFIRWSFMRDHLVEAHKQPERLYRCTECLKTFRSNVGQYHHFKLMHSSDHFVCSYCGIKFPTKSYLENHIVSHTKEKKFSCSMCNKAYPRLKALTRHKRNAHFIETKKQTK